MKIYFGYGPISDVSLKEGEGNWVLGCNIGYVERLCELEWMYQPHEVRNVCEDAYKKELGRYTLAKCANAARWPKQFLANVTPGFFDTPWMKAFLEVFPLIARVEIKDAHRGGVMLLLVLGKPDFMEDEQ